MKILYVGDSKTIVENLLKLGVDEVIFWKSSCSYDIDGIIITRDLLLDEIEKLKRFKVPIVLSSGKIECQKNVDVLIFDENEMNIFCGKNEWDLLYCKNRIKELGIKHLVVSLGKKEIKRYIQQCGLPEIDIREVSITNTEVESVKNTIIAIIGYIYIKEGFLQPDSIRKAGIGAVSEVIRKEMDNCYHLKFYK